MLIHAYSVSRLKEVVTVRLKPNHSNKSAESKESVKMTTEATELDGNGSNIENVEMKRFLRSRLGLWRIECVSFCSQFGVCLLFFLFLCYKGIENVLPL